MTYDRKNNRFVTGEGEIVGYVFRNRKRRTKWQVRNGEQRKPWQVCGPIMCMPAARGRGISFGHLPMGPPHLTHEGAVRYGLAMFSEREAKGAA